MVDLPREMLMEIFSRCDHDTQMNILLTSKDSNKIISTIQFLCYECGYFHLMVEMQDYACSICEGRKCRKLHGGEGNNTCKYCKCTNLCFDCYVFAVCCHVYENDKFVKIK